MLVDILHFISIFCPNNFCLYRSVTCSRKEAYLVERAANGLDALKTLFCDSQPLIMFAFGGLVLPR